MPTGYTASISQGISFKDFALQCARAFGACIALRDDPISSDIPEFHPSDYHQLAMKKEVDRLAALKAMTPDEAEAAALRAYLDEREAVQKRARDRAALRAKYDAMLADVNAWNPPTPDHSGLASFMREQIESSICFDCAHHEQAPVQKNGAEWLAEAVTSAERSIAYHAKEHAAEVERTQQRNAWVRALRASLS